MIFHTLFHRGQKNAYAIEEEYANDLPTFWWMVLRMTVSTIGILSFLVFGSGFFPSVIDLKSNPNLLFPYFFSCALAVAINYTLWLLESTGAVCKEARLGKVNIGRFMNILISGFLVGSAVLYIKSVYQMQGDPGSLQGGLMAIAVIAFAASLFSAWFIQKYMFRRMRLDALQSVKSFIAARSS
jgi:hypothetical protein